MALHEGTTIAADAADFRPLGHPGLYAVILCGGFGARLWPVSRQNLPKQFLPLVGPCSPFQLAVRRARALCPPERIVCVANVIHADPVARILAEESCAARIVLEGQSRNTAAAIACAALVAGKEDADALLLCLPADHHLPDVQSFCVDVANGIDAAQEGWLVIFGIEPTHASTGYGYVQAGERLALASPAHRVGSFIEKPDASVAAELVAAGSVWNSGIVLARADRLVDALRLHQPTVLHACREAVGSARQTPNGLLVDPAPLTACPSVSIDRGVLERDERVAVLPLSGEWADLGSWDSVSQHVGRSEGTNRIDGDARLFECHNLFVRSAADRVAVAIGVSDLIIVDTPNALLVSGRHSADRLAEMVSATPPDAMTTPRVDRARRAWGSCARVHEAPGLSIWVLALDPGKRLAIRCDHAGTDNWIVDRGAAILDDGRTRSIVGQGESFGLRADQARTLANAGAAPACFVLVRNCGDAEGGGPAQ